MKTSELVTFDRKEFSENVKRVLDGDVNDGFVIGLKRKTEFAIQLCQDYKRFSPSQKLDLLLALAVDLGLVDLSQMMKALPSISRSRLVLNVMAAALGFSKKNNPSTSKSVKRGLVPVPEQFFGFVATVPQGPAFLLQLRSDLKDLVKKFDDRLSVGEKEALEYLDFSLKDLFAHQTGTRFKRIDMSNERILAHVVKHERVHAMRDWHDLQRRVVGPNRHCFGLFHLSMPNAPLAFVETILMDHLCSSLDEVLEDENITVLENPSHLVFYSVSNANDGLQGLNVASHVLFLTIEKLRNLYPSLRVFATLSPVPGFAKWFRQELDNEPLAFFTEQQASKLNIDFGVSKHQLGKWLMKRLDSPKWYQDSRFAKAVQPIVVSACARYAMFEKKDDKILDPVTNFHLQNGAQIEQINFLANKDRSAMVQSFGVMINYRYCMPSIHLTSLSYRKDVSVAVSQGVARSVWPTSSHIFDEIEAVREKLSIPLFGRVYGAKKKLCIRGKLPQAVYFICSGSVRVHSAPPFVLNPGSCYGHQEIIRKEPVAYTAVAESTCYVVLLLKDHLLALIEHSTALKHELLLSTPLGSTPEKANVAMSRL